MFMQPLWERDFHTILLFLPFDEIIGKDDECSISIPVDKFEHTWNIKIAIRGNSQIVNRNIS